MENELYEIKDIEEFTTKARSIVYNNFGKWNTNTTTMDDIIDHVKQDEQDDFDKILTQEESILIIKELVKKQINKKTKKAKFIIDDDLFYKIIQDLNDRMVSNILLNLVNKGLVESSYDSSINDFVFWIKDDTPEN